jgi:23S rRNA (cytidine2498-2'-O)-methyltransferase
MADTAGYIAAEGFEAELENELARAGARLRGWHGARLLLADPPALTPAWAEDVWYDARVLPVPSIKQAARALKGLQRNWALLTPPAHVRRASLIAQQLPHVAMKPLVFPDRPPAAPLGGWTLLDAERMLAAPTTLSPFPHGRAQFVEDRENPPNRAYLKLWEALSLLDERPRPGQQCLDLGAAPGGWTWVLAKLGAQVTAVDKAALAANVTAMPGVGVRRDSAFALDPDVDGPVDWLCSDVVCYPNRLYRLVTRWLDAGAARNFVCTVKFQGETNVAAMEAFAALPGSRLMHLHHNKHELTWVSLDRWREASEA